jgi:hypothetical protein
MSKVLIKKSNLELTQKNHIFQSKDCRMLYRMRKGYVLSICNLQKSLISSFFRVDSENDLIFPIWRNTKLTELNLT